VRKVICLHISIMLLSVYGIFDTDSAMAGDGFSLVDEKELEVFDVEKSTPETASEHIREMLERREWLKYDEEVWDDVREKKDEEIYEAETPQPPEELPEVSTAPEMAPEEYPKPTVELPYETRMSITGQKSISVKYGHIFYPYGDEDDRTRTGTPPGTTSGFEMDQDLRVRIQGQVGDKISVDVDYDDTKPEYDESARQISVRYDGDPDEIIQEAAFGDITLSLPSTEYAGYSRNLFGAQVKGRYQDFEFMAIGSQTKGRTDRKVFYGETSFQRRDIKDTNYIKRKYYNVAMEEEHLPIKNLKVYLDDQTGSVDRTEIHNEAVIYGEDDDPYEGSFFKLRSYTDYSISARTGLLTFDRNISREYAIAVEYEYEENGETKTVGADRPVLIKSENEEIEEVRHHELRNRYSLGATRIMRGSFKSEIYDLNRDEIEDPPFIESIDYSRGIMIFEDEKPFYEKNPGLYYDNGDNEKHIIYVEYEQAVRNYMLSPNILRGSERVLLDGELLQRDSDYMIDYPSGFLTFLDPDSIDETTRIEVTYEYMPFAGAFQETLIGARGEYNISRDFFIGGTMLHKWSASPQEMPDVLSTPESMLLLNTDFNLAIPSSRYFPLPTRLDGEVAYSSFNPNRIGTALIDSMQDIRQTHSVSMNSDSWQIAATPSLEEGMTTEPAHPEWLFKKLDCDEVYLSDLNERISDSDDERLRALELRYSIPAEHELDEHLEKPEASVVYVLSRSGLDLRDKDTMSVWIKGDGSGAELQIDFGSISEDADGTGKLKTEDTNRSGSLDEGQDIGWDFVFGEEVIPIGADNGVIDTNDLDRDWRLDMPGAVNTFDSSMDERLKIDWTGWKRIEIERPGEDSDWRAVKHVRLTVRNPKNTEISGNIGITSLEMVGNRWEIGDGHDVLKLNSVNNYDHDFYEPLTDYDYYEDIYAPVGGRDRDREQALELEYSGLKKGATAYAYKRYTNSVDFSKHEKMNFFLYNYKGTDVDFKVTIGAGDNYFYKKIPASELQRTWNRFSLELPYGTYTGDFKKKGNPSITSIREVRLYVINTGEIERDGKIWVNEIHLDDSAKREGTAMRGSFSSSLSGVMDFGGSVEKISKDFQTITGSPRNMDTLTYSARADIKLFPFMPVSGSYSRSRRETPAERIEPDQHNPYIREGDAGLVTSESYRIGINNLTLIRDITDFGASYSGSISESEFSGRIDETQNIRGNISYNFPFKLPLFPENVRLNARKTDEVTSWREYVREEEDKRDGGYEDKLVETKDYSVRTEHSFLDILTLDPSFSRNEKYKTWGYYTGPLKGEEIREPYSKRQNISLSARLSILDWLRPSGSYSARINEHYNFKSVDDMNIPENTKDVNRNYDIDASVRLPVKNLLPWHEVFDTLELNVSYGTERGDTWNNIEGGYGVLRKINPQSKIEPDNNDAILESMTERDSFRINSDWSPFRHIGFDSGISRMIGGMSLRSSFHVRDSKTVEKDSVYKRETLDWPDLRITFGTLDRLPGFQDYVKDMRLRTDFNLKSENNFSDGAEVEDKREIDVGLNSRFTLLDGYDSLLEVSRKNRRETDLIDSETLTYNSLSLSGQVRLDLSRRWSAIVRYSHEKADERSDRTDSLTEDKNIYNPSISLDGVLDLPADFSLPLIGTDVSGLSRMRLDGEVSAEFSRSKLNIERSNYNKFDISMSAETDVAGNMRFSLGFGGQMEYNTEIRENSYIAVYMNSDLRIRF